MPSRAKRVLLRIADALTNLAHNKTPSCMICRMPLGIPYHQDRTILACNHAFHATCLLPLVRPQSLPSNTDTMLTVSAYIVNVMRLTNELDCPACNGRLAELLRKEETIAEVGAIEDEYGEDSDEAGSGLHEKLRSLGVIIVPLEGNSIAKDDEQQKSSR